MKTVEKGQAMNQKNTTSTNPQEKARTLVIEWKHYDVDGETCDRCYDTGENLHAEIKRLQRKLAPQGIDIQLVETKLGESKMEESNQILMNGILIEEIVDLKVMENYCASCSDLAGSETYCRTILFEGQEYDEIPPKAIRMAAMKALGLAEDSSVSAPVTGCGCGCSGGSCC